MTQTSVRDPLIGPSQEAASYYKIKHVKISVRSYI
jgi:hypothetical protein